MNKHEEKARELRTQGNNCSKSLSKAFEDDVNLIGEAPAPRSIEGKCGALLTGIKILKDAGREDKIEEFEEEFLKRFGYKKCAELIKDGRKCADYVGGTAQIIDEILGEK